MMESTTPRWQQRFENYQKALIRLQGAVAVHQAKPKDEYYQLAVIQAFEFTYELGWKTLKDYLSHSGITVNFPKEAIKQAFTTQLITDGQTWIEMLEARNLLSHTYDDEKATLAVSNIVAYYLEALINLKHCLEVAL